MIKTFITGIVIGIVAVIAALHLFPAVDQAREASIISVSPNGGNRESFHVNIPMDRIMVGAQGRDNPLPPGMVWPGDPLLAGTRAELFKLRNSRDAVIGVASRIAARDQTVGQIVEWVLHMPARGSIFVTMSPQSASGSRVGSMRAGTREFATLVGRVSERWQADAEGSANAGRIQLDATFVSSEMYVPEPIDDEAAEDAE